MPIPPCDRPPRSTAAIVMYVTEQTTPFGFEADWTTRVPSSAIRTDSRRHVTNTSPDLSISRAQVQSLAHSANIELDQYSRFSVGWDGYSAEAISPAAIEAARYLMSILSGMNGVQRLTDAIPGPAPDGSLDLDLRTANRRLILTIYPGVAPNEIEVRTFRTDGNTSEEKNDLEPDALVADLRWLLA